MIKDEDYVAKKIGKLIREGKPQKQVVAYSMGRKGKK